MAKLGFAFDASTVPVRKSWPPLVRSSLPSPLSYLHSKGFRIGKRGGEWVRVRCPIHNGGAERNASMSVNKISGGFRCFSCGVKGGDIIALHRLVTGLGFRDAVADLGGRFDE